MGQGLAAPGLLLQHRRPREVQDPQPKLWGLRRLGRCLRRTNPPRVLVIHEAWTAKQGAPLWDAFPHTIPPLLQSQGCNLSQVSK